MDTDKLANMTEQLGQWIAKTADQIGDYAAVQIPPLITEYLQWKFLENVASIGFMFLVILGFFVVCRMIRKWAKNSIDAINKDPKMDDNQKEKDCIPIILFGRLLPLAVFFIATAFAFPSTEIKDCIKIKYAPKVYLIEEGVRLAKEMKR